jgi:hypothetical protein
MNEAREEMLVHDQDVEKLLELEIALMSVS